MPTVVTSSIGTTGRDYSTWQSWEDDIPADLVAADVQHVGEGFNDSEFTAAGVVLNVGGHTTDATRNIIATTGAGQSFRDHANKATNPLRYNAAVGVALRKTGNYNATIQLNTGSTFTVIKNLQVKNDGSGLAIESAVAVRHDIDSCITESASAPVILLGNAATVINTLAMLRLSASGYGISWSYPASGALIAGCTVVRPSGLTAAAAGVQANSSNLTIKNTAVFGFADFASGANNVGDFNGSDVATNIPGGNSNGALVYADQFQDEGNTTPDFRALESGGLKFGTPDATNTPDDIIGTTRDATTPYVGAWEVPGGGGGGGFIHQPDKVGGKTGGGKTGGKQ